MTDPTDKTPDEQDRLTELKSIREVMAAVQAEQMDEIRVQRAEIQRKKREVRDKRAKTRRERDKKRVKEAQATLTKAFKHTTDMVGERVAAATSSLRAARRAATQYPLPRESPEARDAQRMARDIDAALGALRRVGRGTFHEADVDLDLEVEVDTN